MNSKVVVDSRLGGSVEVVHLSMGIRFSYGFTFLSPHSARVTNHRMYEPIRRQGKAILMNTTGQTPAPQCTCAPYTGFVVGVDGDDDSMHGPLTCPAPQGTIEHAPTCHP